MNFSKEGIYMYGSPGFLEILNKYPVFRPIAENMKSYLETSALRYLCEVEITENDSFVSVWCGRTLEKDYERFADNHPQEIKAFWAEMQPTLIHLSRLNSDKKQRNEVLETAPRQSRIDIDYDKLNRFKSGISDNTDTTLVSLAGRAGNSP